MIFHFYNSSSQYGGFWLKHWDVLHQLASGIQPSCFELFSGSKVSFSPIMTSEIQTPKKRCCELQLPRDLKKDQKQSEDNS